MVRRYTPKYLAIGLPPPQIIAKAIHRNIKREYLAYRANVGLIRITKYLIQNAVRQELGIDFREAMRVMRLTGYLGVVYKELDKMLRKDGWVLVAKGTMAKVYKCKSNKCKKLELTLKQN